jgi:hypothetical protein
MSKPGMTPTKAKMPASLTSKRDPNWPLYTLRSRRTVPHKMVINKPLATTALIITSHS